MKALIQPHPTSSRHIYVNGKLYLRPLAIEALSWGGPPLLRRLKKQGIVL